MEENTEDKISKNTISNENNQKNTNKNIEEEPEKETKFKNVLSEKIDYEQRQYLKKKQKNNEKIQEEEEEEEEEGKEKEEEKQNPQEKKYNLEENSQYTKKKSKKLVKIMEQNIEEQVFDENNKDFQKNNNNISEQLQKKPIKSILKQQKKSDTETLKKQKSGIYGRVVGRGMVSIVYQVKDNENQVIKRHKKDKEKYYLNEKSILEKIKHLDITPDIFQYDDEEMAIFMQRGYYSLAQLNKEKIRNLQEWTQKEIYTIIKTLFKFIKKLANLQIYHSEIRIDNIISIDDDLDIRLIDFGGSCDSAKQYWRVCQKQNSNLSETDLKVECHLREVESIIKVGQQLMTNVLAYREQQQQSAIIYQPNKEKKQEQMKTTLSLYYPDLMEMIKKIKQQNDIRSIEKIINKTQFNVTNFDRRQKKKVNQVQLDARQKEEEIQKKKQDIMIQKHNEDLTANLAGLKKRAKIQISKNENGKIILLEKDKSGQELKLQQSKSRKRQLKAVYEDGEYHSDRDLENNLEDGEVMETYKNKKKEQYTEDDKKEIATEHKQYWLQKYKQREERKKKEQLLHQSRRKKLLLQDTQLDKKRRRSKSKTKSKSRSKSRKMREMYRDIPVYELNPLQEDLAKQMKEYEQNFPLVLDFEVILLQIQKGLQKKLQTDSVYLDSRYTEQTDKQLQQIENFKQMYQNHISETEKNRQLCIQDEKNIHMKLVYKPLTEEEVKSLYEPIFYEKSLNPELYEHLSDSESEEKPKKNEIQQEKNIPEQIKKKSTEEAIIQYHDEEEEENQKKQKEQEKNDQKKQEQKDIVDQQQQQLSNSLDPRLKNPQINADNSNNIFQSLNIIQPQQLKQQKTQILPKLNIIQPASLNQQKVEPQIFQQNLFLNNMQQQQQQLNQFQNFLPNSGILQQCQDINSSGSLFENTKKLKKPETVFGIQDEQQQQQLNFQQNTNNGFQANENPNTPAQIQVKTLKAEEQEQEEIERLEKMIESLKNQVLKSEQKIQMGIQRPTQKQSNSLISNTAKIELNVINLYPGEQDQIIQKQNNFSQQQSIFENSYFQPYHQISQQQIYQDEEDSDQENQKKEKKKSSDDVIFLDQQENNELENEADIEELENSLENIETQIQALDFFQNKFVQNNNNNYINKSSLNQEEIPENQEQKPENDILEQNQQKIDENIQEEKQVNLKENTEKKQERKNIEDSKIEKAEKKEEKSEQINEEKTTKEDVKSQKSNEKPKKKEGNKENQILQDYFASQPRTLKKLSPKKKIDKINNNDNRNKYQEEDGEVDCKNTEYIFKKKQLEKEAKLAKEKLELELEVQEEEKREEERRKKKEYYKKIEEEEQIKQSEKEIKRKKDKKARELLTRQQEDRSFPKIELIQGETQEQYEMRYMIFKNAFQKLQNYNRALSISILYYNIKFQGVRYTLQVTQQLQQYLPLIQRDSEDEEDDEGRRKSKKSKKSKKYKKEKSKSRSVSRSYIDKYTRDISKSKLRRDDNGPRKNSSSIYREDSLEGQKNYKGKDSFYERTDSRDRGLKSRENYRDKRNSRDFSGGKESYRERSRDNNEKENKQQQQYMESSSSYRDRYYGGDTNKNRDYQNSNNSKTSRNNDFQNEEKNDRNYRSGSNKQYFDRNDRGDRNDINRGSSRGNREDRGDRSKSSRRKYSK